MCRRKRMVKKKNLPKTALKQLILMPRQLQTRQHRRPRRRPLALRALRPARRKRRRKRKAARMATRMAQAHLLRRRRNLRERSRRWPPARSRQTAARPTRSCSTRATCKPKLKRKLSNSSRHNSRRNSSNNSMPVVPWQPGQPQEFPHRRVRLRASTSTNRPDRRVCQRRQEQH